MLSFDFTSGPADASIKSFKKAEASEFAIEAEIASERGAVVTVLFLTVSADPSKASNAVNSGSDVA
jgi:hypothetical protein